MGIKIEERDTRGSARFIFFAIFMSGRYEGEPSSKGSHLRLRRAFDGSVAARALTLLVRHKQMLRRAKSVYDCARPPLIDGFNRHAVSCQALACDDIRWRNLYRRMRDAPNRSTSRPSIPRAFAS